MTLDPTTASPHPDASRGPAGGDPKRPTCSTCPYWLHGYRGPHPAFAWITERVTRYAGGSPPDVREPIHFGDCRRRAARPAAMEDGDSFGRTHREDWCGEHPDFPEWLALARTSSSPGPAGVDGAAAGGGAE